MLARTFLKLLAGLAFGWALAVPTAALADNVHVGDTFQITLFGEDAAWTDTVAADGTIRLSGVSTVEVAGLSFDEAEKALSEAVAAVEFFVSPRVSLTLTGRAPIFVTGDVRDPGAFDYRPQLTVGIGVGLAGGASLGGETGDASLATAEVAGQIALADQEIARVLARMARIEADLAGFEEAAISEGRLALLSPAERENATQFLSLENAIMRNARVANELMIAEWDREIEETQTQIGLLERRLTVQDEVAALVQEQLNAATGLRQRGLTTQSDVSRLEERNAGALARLLELEALLSQARSRLAESRRGRAGFNKNEMSALLEQRRETRAELDRLLQRRSTASEKQALLGSRASEATDDAVRIVHTLRRIVPSGVETAVVDRDTTLQPGDAIDVTVIVPDGPDFDFGIGGDVGPVEGGDASTPSGTAAPTAADDVPESAALDVPATTPAPAR